MLFIKDLIKSENEKQISKLEEVIFSRTEDFTDMSSYYYTKLYEFWNNNIPSIPYYEILLKKDTIIQFGFPPNRLDLINSIDGIGFEECWKNKFSIEYEIKDIFI